MFINKFNSNKVSLLCTNVQGVIISFSGGLDLNYLRFFVRKSKNDLVFLSKALRNFFYKFSGIRLGASLFISGLNLHCISGLNLEGIVLFKSGLQFVSATFNQALSLLAPLKFDKLQIMFSRVFYYIINLKVKFLRIILKSIYINFIFLRIKNYANNISIIKGC